MIRGKNDIGATITEAQSCIRWHDGDLDHCNSKNPIKYRIEPYGGFRKGLTLWYSEFPFPGPSDEASYHYWGIDDNGNSIYLETWVHSH